MNERDRVRLQDMLAEARRVQEFLADKSHDELLQDTMLSYAVIRAIEIVGEAAAQTSSELQQRHPEIPWRNMIGMRNRIVHGYSSVDLNIVWEVATRNLPTLMPLLKNIRLNGISGGRTARVSTGPLANACGSVSTP
jgi:uncharacterized protein with HEPN domain